MLSILKLLNPNTSEKELVFEKCDWKAMKTVLF
jgi:hypothetical protein